MLISHVRDLKYPDLLRNIDTLPCSPCFYAFAVTAHGLEILLRFASVWRRLAADAVLDIVLELLHASR